MVLLAATAWRLGRAGHVELLLLLGNVGQNRTEPLVLNDRRLVDLRPFVEGAVGQIDAIVPDRKPSIRSISVRLIVITVIGPIPP